MKWFLLFGGIALAYLWFKGKKKAAVAATQASKSQSLRPKVSNPEVMVRCQYCAVHLPQSEAIAKDDRFYCSEKHIPILDATGWLGSATWRISPNQDNRPEGITPDLLVLHHISLPPSGFVESSCTPFIIDFFQNKLDLSKHPYFKEIADQAVSSHFLISRAGEVFQFVSTQKKAWHAGQSSYFGREKCNDFSIGIELEGDGTHPFEEMQYVALVTLIDQLGATHPNLTLAGHSDIAPGRKADPGIQFDWKSLQTKSNISAEKFPYGLDSR